MTLLAKNLPWQSVIPTILGLAAILEGTELSKRIMVGWSFGTTFVGCSKTLHAQVNSRTCQNQLVCTILDTVEEDHVVVVHCISHETQIEYGCWDSDRRLLGLTSICSI